MSTLLRRSSSRVSRRSPFGLGLPLLVAAAGLVAGASSCAKPVSGDRAQVDSAVQRLQSGQTIRDLNGGQEQPPEVLRRNPEPSTENVSREELLDPCPGVPRPASTAPEADLKAALTQFGACLRMQLGSSGLAAEALTYFSAFKREAGARPLSSMTDEELNAYLRSNSHSLIDLLGADAAARSGLRVAFTDADLDELQALATRKRQALVRAEARIYAALDARRTLVDHYARTINRYAALVALRLNSTDVAGMRTAEALATALAPSGMQLPDDFSRFPVSLLHPYAIEAIVPDPGQEQEQLHPAENPFARLLDVLGQFGGPQAINQQLRDLYRAGRDHDNPAIPTHDAASAHAVRVAVIDTGIDFVKQPDLALFLGSGAPQGSGSLLSHDYGDDDANPWLLASGELAHGTGTTATVLTVLAHYAPEVLRARQLDLAVWKVESTRELLSGPFGHMGTWDNRAGVQEAILDQLRSPGVKPDVVSISMGFPMSEALARVRQTDLIERSPWLWVMAAGNDGVEVPKGQIPTCFSDIPAERRPDSRILCVGALLQGVVNDHVAGYSNYGDRVDVYAYQSYIDLCPNGTSCATPAVAAAVALIKAKYPSLTPEQLKQVIVESAESRTLQVDADGYNGPVPTTSASPSPEGGAPAPILRTVKVFDPPSMMARALENARALAR